MCLALTKRDARQVPLGFSKVDVAPVFFRAYASNGTELDISAGKTLSNTANTDPTYQFVQNIKNVRITFTTQGVNKDSDANKTIQVTMTGMARLPNN